uniref:Uncharacterized protein n=1 Tax=Neogobius melanostomus TaxID=47308 RepID=A0A8C6UBM9_9GOBI
MSFYYFHYKFLQKCFSSSYETKLETFPALDHSCFREDYFDKAFSFGLFVRGRQTQRGEGSLTSGKLLMLTTMSCGDFMEIWPSWFRGNFPAPKQDTHIHEVLMLRFRVKSSLRASRTAFMSIFTSFRSMMSSTRAELILTLVACPFALARG